MGRTPADPASERVSVAFDIGGTNLRAAAVSTSGAILSWSSLPTPSTSDAMRESVMHLVHEMQASYRVDAVGLAVAGFIDPECEMVRFAPHLPWRNHPVRAELSDALGLPVCLEHDANAAAWGEHLYGAGQGRSNWVLFALGTGIGAALIQNGEIYRGAFGTAPEFGHLTVVPGGRPCACGKRGCLERYCSGTALVQTAEEMLEEHSGSSLLDAAHREGRLDGKAVIKAAERGDAVAQAVVEDFGRWLGLALSIVVDVLDPAHIVIGGGLSNLDPKYFVPAQKYMAENIVGAGHRPLPTVQRAVLREEAGVIGVAALARRLATGS